MRDEKFCGHESKKECAITSSFRGVLFIVSILAPNIFIAFMGIRMLESFCETDKICNKYFAGSQTLIGNAKVLGYFSAAGFSLTGSGVTLLAMLLAKCCANRYCTKAETDNDEEDRSLLPNDYYKGCCGLFKKFKDTVLPSRAEVSQLFIVFLGLLASEAFTAMFVSFGIIGNLDNNCNHPKIPDDPPYNCFINATSSELTALQDCQNNIIKTMVGTGVGLGALISIIITVVTMSIAACMKCTMTSNDDRGNSHTYEL